MFRMSAQDSCKVRSFPVTLRFCIANLLTARATVHFNAITEHFSPHDTEFSIASSKELRDTTLSAACSLHTASGSISSSTSSLRRRRLMEIAEEAEEDAKRQSTVVEERPSSAKPPAIDAASVTIPASPPTLKNTGSYRSVISDLETSPPPPREPQLELRPQSPLKSQDDRRRISSQSVRPNLYSLQSYGSNGKPKIKLGPRPSLDVGGRPHTASATSHFRPVSTLPAGLKLFSRATKKDKGRPKSHLPTDPPSMTISPPLVHNTMEGSFQLPQTRPHTSGGRPTTNSGMSMKSAASPRMGTFPKMPTITPEKARLMKALELRKKRELLSPIATASSISTVEEVSARAPPENKALSTERAQGGQEALATLNDMTKADDSGIAFDASSTVKTDESDATRSDSYPVSPIGPSERAQSTKASSISESTDGTVQETQSSKATIREPGLIEGGSERVIEQTLETPTSVQEEAATEVEAIKELPLTEQITHPLVRSPTMSHFKGKGFETSKNSTTVDLLDTMLKEPLVTPEHPRHDPPSMHLLHEIEAEELAEEAAVVASDSGLPAETLATTAQSLRPELKERGVPRSKCSAHNPKVTRESCVAPTETMPAPSNAAAGNAILKSPVGSILSADSKRSLTDDEQQENGPISPKRRKRRAIIQPIRTDFDAADISATESVANISSDDELMEELQSAVLQEAKPISVAKSPKSPGLPSPNKKVGNVFSRAFSNPMRKESSDSQNLTPPELGRSESSRSVSASAAYLNRINHEPTKPMAKKVNVGSGISQRIKALEKLSSIAPGGTNTSGTTAPSTGASPAFFSVRRGSVRPASKSPSIAERANSLTRDAPSPSPPISREASPEAQKLRDRSGSIQDRLNAFSVAPVISSPQQSRPESISVTARIIRDPHQPFPKAELGKDLSDYASLDLKQSPLVIDHQKAVVAPQPPIKNLQERRLSTSSRTTTKSSRSSITVVKDLIKERRASFAERRRSITSEPPASSSSIISVPGQSPSRPSSVHQPLAHQRPLMISSQRSSRDMAFSPPPTTAESFSTNDDKDKKSHRASRMLRRMSSSLSSNRKTLTSSVSPAVREESEPLGLDSRSVMASHPSNYSIAPSTSSTNIGDVNVQFPDTLLWKRRSMLLDFQGSLILSPALSNGSTAKEKTNGGATRRFHLSEFRTPGIPDVEMQELPNSVVLDFIEGGGLQIACEDRAGQMRVLGGKIRYSLYFSSFANRLSPSRSTSHLGSLWPIITIADLTSYEFTKPPRWSASAPFHAPHSLRSLSLLL